MFKDKMEFKDHAKVVLGCGFCGQAVTPGEEHNCAGKIEAEKQQKQKEEQGNSDHDEGKH